MLGIAKTAQSTFEGGDPGQGLAALSLPGRPPTCLWLNERNLIRGEKPLFRRFGIDHLSPFSDEVGPISTPPPAPQRAQGNTKPIGLFLFAAVALYLRFHADLAGISRYRPDVSRRRPWVIL
jgi:hypothetical protein